MVRSPLLEGVSPQDCQAMRNCLGVYEQRFQPGDVLYDFGDGRNMLGILMEGTAEIERIDAEGSRTILEHLEPGGVFGEMMMFKAAGDDSLVVRGATPCLVSFLRGEAVMRRCEHACACHSRMVENLFRLVTEKPLPCQNGWRCSAAAPSGKSCCAILNCRPPNGMEDLSSSPFPSALWRIISPLTAAP